MRTQAIHRKEIVMKKQLPSYPNLEQLKKQAKTILKGHQAANPNILKEIREHHPHWHKASEAELQRAHVALSDAQLVLAREYGFASWSKLKAHVVSAAPPGEAAVKTLRDAAGRGDLLLLAELLDAHPGLINERGGPGTRTALHSAVFGGQEGTVKFLLERGADPNIRCEGDYAFPLHFACEKQHLPIIRLLIEGGADPVGEGDYHELGVIGWATAWDYLKPRQEIVDYLLSHGATHNIFSAVAMGEVDAIRKLVVTSPADLEKRMDGVRMRRYPLHLAVVKKQREALSALLDLGANIEALDEAGFTALDQAAFLGETAMAQVLLDRGAKVRLPAAIALDRTRDINKLLRDDPECLKPGNRWGNLIVRASEQASGAVVERLIRAGASVDVRDDPKTSVDSTSGYTPLHAAAFQGNIDAVRVLLRHGANVRGREERYHSTPAGWANYAGHTQVRDLILERPVDIKEAVEFGLTKRIIAILGEDPDTLHRKFGDYQLHPLYAEGWYTPLAFAVVRGNMESVRVLLDHGADATLRAPDNRTLYEMAQEKGHEEIAALLKAHSTGST
jgi:ankyrin repeat protein